MPKYLIYCMSVGSLALSSICGQPANNGNKVSPQQFVPSDINIADGQSHPLSERFQRLEQAKVRYPMVTSLINEFAWVGWQMALNRALTAGRVTINVPPGIYRVHPLVFYSNTTITGSGYTLLLTFDQPPQTADNQRLLSPATYVDRLTSNFSIEGGTLDGDYDHINWSAVKGDGGGHGLTLWGVWGGTVRNMVIRNMYTDAIFICDLKSRSGQDTENVTFDHIRIEHCGRQGVSIISGSNLTFKDIEVRDIQRIAPGAAFDLEPNNKLEPIKNITIDGVTGDHLRAGILVTSLATPSLTENITIKNVLLTDITNTHGFLAHNMSHLNVDGYHVEMAPNVKHYPAMELGDGVQSSEVHNVHTRHGLFGIRVRTGAKDVHIETADVANAWMEGVSLEANTTGTLRNAKVADNNKSGGNHRDVSAVSNDFHVERSNQISKSK